MSKIIRDSQKIYQLFSKRKRRQKLRILLHHPEHGFGLFRVESVVRIMDKVASGSKFTILMLVKIPAHLLSKRRLMHHQLLQPVREEAIVPVHAVPVLSEPLAQLHLPLAPCVGYRLIVQNLCTHDQKPIILLPLLTITKTTPTHPLPISLSHLPHPTPQYLHSHFSFLKKKKKFRFEGVQNKQINVFNVSKQQSGN